MPLIIDKDTKWYYTGFGARAVDWPPNIDEILLNWKKQFYNEWQEFKALLHTAHKEKYEKSIVELFKEQEAFNRKHYRALTFIVPWVINKYPGDCKFINKRKWPIDLVNEFDNIYNRIINY